MFLILGFLESFICLTTLCTVQYLIYCSGLPCRIVTNIHYFHFFSIPFLCCYSDWRLHMTVVVSSANKQFGCEACTHPAVRCWRLNTLLWLQGSQMAFSIALCLWGGAGNWAQGLLPSKSVRHSPAGLSLGLESSFSNHDIFNSCLCSEIYLQSNLGFDIRVDLYCVIIP